jgi:hypothetical protein
MELKITSNYIIELLLEILKFNKNKHVIPEHEDRSQNNKLMGGGNQKNLCSWLLIILFF